MNKIVSIYFILLINSLIIFSPQASAYRTGLTLLTDQPIAKDIPLQDLEGKLHKISDYRGKIVVVNYFIIVNMPRGAIFF